jgi:FAD/FMN-containing dehydrogenase
MMADGEIVTASRTENVDLFRSAIGGEGAVGIIVEAKLGLAENTKLDRSVRNFTATKDGLVDMIKDYITYFDKEVLGTGQAEMTNAILYPPDYRTLRSVTFNRTDKPLTITDQMQNLPTTKWGWLYRGALNSIVSLFDFIKKFRESQYDRQEEPQVVMRNWEASEDVESLKGLNEQFPWIKRIFPFSNRKALLQEYFIPREALPQFIERLVAVFTKYDVNVINISLRRIPANDESYMSWSRHEGFAVVVYYSQPYRGDKNQQLAKHRIWTREIIDEINRVDGSYYLPYLVEASQEQFQKAYPNYKKFFEVKKHFDPNNRFTNNLWAQYYKP